jgi:PilZ domain-containing protein
VNVNCSPSTVAGTHKEINVEHRWGARLTVRTSVLVRARGGLRGIGYISDMSISGARLVTSLRAAPLSRVKLFLSDDSGESIEAQVVRETGNGFAVEWCEFAPEVVRSLAHTEVPMMPSLLKRA